MESSSSSSSSSRSLSPTRNVYHPSAFSISLRRSSSPTRAAVGAPYVPSAAAQVRTGAGARAAKKRTCACSPTTHPGSFRCSLHRNGHGHGHGDGDGDGQGGPASAWSGALNMRRSAMVNSIVRIGSVEGEWVKRALTTLIRPSSHHMRRRAAFQPRPSRLRHMTCACR